MFQLTKKLVFLKGKFKEWNSSHFKNFFLEKGRIQREIEYLNDYVLRNGMNSTSFDRHKSLRS